MRLAAWAAVVVLWPAGAFQAPVDRASRRSARGPTTPTPTPPRIQPPRGKAATGLFASTNEAVAKAPPPKRPGPSGKEVEAPPAKKEGKDGLGGVVVVKEAVAPSFKARVERFVNLPEFEVASAFLVFVSCTLYVVSSEVSLSPADAVTLVRTEDALSAIFTAEYIARWYASSFSLRYALQPLTVADLLSFTPFLLEKAFGGGGDLSFLRLLRIFRIQRVLRDVDSFTSFKDQLFGTKPEHPATVRPSRAERMRDETILQLARVFSSLFTLLFVASGLIYNAEHDANPAMGDFASVFYFGLTTLTTVGFGDIVPVTTNGRIVVSASILVGIAVIPLQLTQLAESLLSRQRELQIMEQKTVARSTRLDRLDRACPVCNERAHRRDATFCFRCGAGLPLGLQRSNNNNSNNNNNNPAAGTTPPRGPTNDADTNAATDEENIGKPTVRRKPAAVE